MRELDSSSTSDSAKAGATEAPAPAQRPRVALVHDWLTGMRGGERCLEVFCELLPEAELFTLFHHEGSVTPVIEDRKIHRSILDRMPILRDRYRTLIPLYPWAIERFDLSGFDRIFSLSHCVAKGVVKAPGARHTTYCFTPVRYFWDMYDQYFPPERLNFLTRRVVPRVAERTRKWDVRSTDRVDRIIAISDYVSDRIQRCWGRESEVIYPPVDLSRFAPSPQRGDFFLMVSAFAPYKRVDLAIEAFSRLGWPLKIVGAGQDEERLKSMSAGSVEFLGWRSDEEIAELYARCRAFVFPGEEDFGITPLEAQAAGRPVIAFGRGGACETVVSDPGFPSTRGESTESVRPTGVLFGRQDVDTLVAALRHFVDHEARFDDPEPMMANAVRFSLDAFRRNIERLLAEEGALPGGRPGPGS